MKVASTVCLSLWDVEYFVLGEKEEAVGQRGWRAGSSGKDGGGGRTRYGIDTSLLIAVFRMVARIVKTEIGRNGTRSAIAPIVVTRSG